MVLCGKHIRTRQFQLIPALMSFDGPFIFKCCQNGEPNTSIRILKSFWKILTQQTLPMKYTRFAPRCTASSRHHGNRKVQRKDLACQIVGVPDRLRTCRSPGAGLVKHVGEPSTSTATVVSFHDNPYLNFRVRRHTGTCFWATARRSRIENCVP